MADETGMKAPTSFTTMYMHAAPQDAVPASMPRIGAIGRLWRKGIGTMHNPADGSRRIPLPRTPVNNQVRLASLTKASLFDGMCSP